METSNNKRICIVITCIILTVVFGYFIYDWLTPIIKVNPRGLALYDHEYVLTDSAIEYINQEDFLEKEEGFYNYVFYPNTKLGNYYTAIFFFNFSSRNPQKNASLSITPKNLTIEQQEYDVYHPIPIHNMLGEFHN